MAIGDVSSLAQVETIVETSTEQLGPLSTMVANAGICQMKPVIELTEEDFQKTFKVNVFGVYASYAAASKQMIKQGNGGKLIGAARCA